MAGVLVRTALLTACSNSSASASLRGPLLVSGGSWDAGMAAQVGGQLARVEVGSEAVVFNVGSTVSTEPVL
ncbi:hypothetical protein MO973_17990 [Paenibacillus sp. TRM 82003]|nr:hypothetical protein [Paenibacillus sp. TRM 82003]